MVTRVARILAATALAVLGLVSTGIPTRAADVSTLLATGNYTSAVQRPLTDGAYVAWVYGASTPATSCQTLNVVPVAAPAAITAVAITKAASFALAGDLLVWVNRATDCSRSYGALFDPGVYGLNLRTGQQLVVSTDAAKLVTIADDTVVWSANDDTSGGLALRIRERSVDGGETTTIATVDAGITVPFLSVDGPRISWVEYNPEAQSSRVLSALPGEQPAELMTTSQIFMFDLRGGWMVWMDTGAQLQARALSTGETRTISDQSPSAISLDGRYVLFWVGGSEFARGTFEAYDLASDSLFTLFSNLQSTDADLTQVYASSTGGGEVAWMGVHSQQSLTEIWVASLASFLPTSPQPDPGTTDPSWIWYPETSHYLASGFKTFWEHNGGLPVFGYPLTEEFTEGGYTVQYLERQRFEYHPEFTGTPYEVELGLLGVTAAQRQNLLGTAPFQKLPADTRSDANCQFFTETSHRLCFGFKAYWQSHGLGFGDPGVSYRESLALFGYPISEEFTDPATGLTVQYFERAVFEYHPENAGTPYTILLRRLGAEELQARDWLS